jgi:hypothetical protein
MLPASPTSAGGQEGAGRPGVRYPIITTRAGRIRNCRRRRLRSTGALVKVLPDVDGFRTAVMEMELAA